ncbi:MAG: hypothetical protein LKH45_04200, partial [Acetobacter sp.]|nr:hypothetical protein [Acetobacter sp.]
AGHHRNQSERCSLGAPCNLDVIKPAHFTRNYPVFAGLQLRFPQSCIITCGGIYRLFLLDQSEFPVDGNMIL